MKKGRKNAAKVCNVYEQGPPGAGKSFLGRKVVEILMSMKKPLKTPVLVMTYKNHALDEFLKGSLSFLRQTEIARIGGRSKEEVLDNCNLKELKKTAPKSKHIEGIEPN